jgi:hypothetical protein
MWFVGPGKPAPVRTRKRRHERYVSDLLTCALGNVLDLSASGIRIGCRGWCKLKRGQVVPLTLQAPQGELTLQAKVVRKVRRGLRAHELGLEFVGMTPRTAASLKSLAEFGFVGSGGGIAGTFVGSHEAGDMGGGPRPSGGGTGTKATAAQMKLEWAQELLRVDSGATAEEIRAAYRKLARRYHPDSRPGPNADRKFAELVEAYRLLRDRAGAADD